MQLLSRVIGSALLLASSSTLALPQDWNAFVVCTREFQWPRPRPSGRNETIVQAQQVIEKCYAVAPPDGGLPAHGEYGPAVPSALDTQTAEDIPCSKIAAARRRLAERRDAVQDELRELSAAIESGEAALDVATRVSQALELEAGDAQAACRRAEDRVDREYGALAARLRADCPPRRPPAQRAVCYEEAADNAWVATENSSAKALATRACAMAAGLHDRYTRGDEVRGNLASELARSRDRQVDLRREARDIAGALRTFDEREKSGDCKR